MAWVIRPQAKRSRPNQKMNQGSETLRDERDEFDTPEAASAAVGGA
jgi:hypothetical protein